MKMIRNAFLRMDLFSAAPTFRAKGEASYQTLIGGIISFIIIGSFIGIFANTFIGVLNRINIISQTKFENQEQSTQIIENFKFAIGIQGTNMTNIKKYFKIQMAQYYIGSFPGFEIFELKQCQKEDWKILGQNYGKIYDKFNMENMFCPPTDKDYGVFGVQGSDQFQTIYLQIKRCMNSSTCVNDTLYNQFVTDTKLQTGTASVYMYFLDNLLSVGEQNPVNPVLQKGIALPFGSTIGSRAAIFLSAFQIITDQSILPYQQQEQIDGYTIESYKIYTIELATYQIGTVWISKSSKKTSVNRIHEKLDQMLSYVGGLFGLLFGVMVFFFASFSQYRYQLYASQGSFVAMNSQNKRIKSENFHFLRYLKYVVYDWLDAFGIAPDWQDAKEYHQVREQVNAQMDINLILTKLNYLDKVSKLILDEHRQICLYLTGPPTIEQANKIRRVMEFYDKNRDMNQELKQNETLKINGQRGKKIFENSGSRIFSQNFEGNHNDIAKQSNDNLDLQNSEENQFKREMTQNIIKIKYGPKNSYDQKIRTQFPDWINNIVLNIMDLANFQGQKHQKLPPIINNKSK